MNTQIIMKKKFDTTIVYDEYWRFATERQNIFFSRFYEKRAPWTSDTILDTYKFTNAYRASDRVSQYLISNIIYSGNYSEKDILFRILLFKIFNKIETWEYIQNTFGEISYYTFDFKKIGEALTRLKKNNSLYSAAYIMASPQYYFGKNYKHLAHLELLQYMMKDDLYNKIKELKSLKGLYLLLKKYPSIGDFLAYQYAIDINYSNICDFDENEFIKAGPGAISGISKCFRSTDDISEEYIIKYMVEIQHKEFERLGLDFNNLWGRDLKGIDCQNLFCEIDKYARIKYPNIKGNGRTKIKQKFTPKQSRINYFYPPKWNLDINRNVNLYKERYYAK